MAIEQEQPIEPVLRELMNGIGRTREALLAEFLDKQLWQFVSLDEWLEANRTIR